MRSSGNGQKNPDKVKETRLRSGWGFLSSLYVNPLSLALSVVGGRTGKRFIRIRRRRRDTIRMHHWAFGPQDNKDPTTSFTDHPGTDSNAAAGWSGTRAQICSNELWTTTRLTKPLTLTGNRGSDQRHTTHLDRGSTWTLLSPLVQFRAQATDFAFACRGSRRRRARPLLSAANAGQGSWC